MTAGLDDTGKITIDGSDSSNAITVNAASGSAAFTVVAGSAAEIDGLTIGGAVTTAGTLTLNGDVNPTSNNFSVEVLDGGTLYLPTSITLASLTIDAGGFAQQTCTDTTFGSEVLTVGSLTIDDPSGTTNGGVLDLGNGDLIAQAGISPDVSGYTGESETDQIEQWLAEGYDGGLWDGQSEEDEPLPSAIISSAAADDLNGMLYLAGAEVGSGAGDLGLSSFDNDTVSPGDFIVSLNYVGNTDLDTIPDAPTNLQVLSYSSNEVDLEWANGGITGAETEVYVSTDGVNYSEFGSVPAGNTTYNATSLEGGTQYWFEVFAATGPALSTPSNAESIITTGVPQPEDVSAAAVSPSEVDLAWDSPTGGVVTGFEVQRSSDQGQSWTTLYTGDGAGSDDSYQDTTTSDGTDYLYQVINTTPNGNSAPSDTTEVVTPLNAPTTSAPTIADASDGGAITLNWSENTSDSSGDVQFEIDRSKDGGQTWCTVDQTNLGDTSDTFTDAGVSAGTSYQYRILAENTVSQSLYSIFDGLTTTTAPTGMATEYGEVELPVTQVITKDQIKSALSEITEPIKADKDSIVKAVTAALNDYKSTLKDAAKSQLISTNFDALIDQLAASATKQINELSDKFSSKIDDAVDDAAGQLANTLSVAAAKGGFKIKVTGDYHYHQGSRSPGDPGWQNVSAKPANTGGISVGGSVEFEIQAGAAAGVQVQVPLKLKLELETETELEATSLHVDHPELPTTNVTVTPELKTKFSFKLEGGAGFTVGSSGSITHLFELPEVSGNLTADGKVR